MTRLWLALAALLLASLLCAARPERDTLEQRIYLPHCTGAWYLSGQGTAEDEDWALLKCEDHSNDDLDPPDVP